MGISTNNVTQRVLAAKGLVKGFDPSFGNHNSVEFGGVILLLPALISQGLLKISDSHKINEGYYSLESIIITLAFMSLCRIKNPEQLAHCKAGELGKLIGYDRVPETKCLRNKIKALSANQTTAQLNDTLSKDWLKDEQDMILYVDGHVKIYNGDLANLTKKYVSRQKLCLTATADFWLNDSQGQPIMVWTGDLNEKLQYMIEYEMIPRLLTQGIIAKATEGQLTAVCTLVFDREAYEPLFFIRLWEKYKIAIITYRKHVKDKWNTTLFHDTNVIDKYGNENTMQLCEQAVTLKGHVFREVRRLNSNEHQTAIITTHPTITTKQIATNMFDRWQQENYFKYMLAEYSLDHIYEYGTQSIDINKEIVNPAYRKLMYHLKKEKEKLGRLEKTLLKNVDLKQEDSMQEIQANIKAKASIVEKIELKKKQIKELEIQKTTTPHRIKLADMTEQNRHNALKKESAYFMATLKMICYRAETALANQLNNIYKKAEEEKRAVIKEIIFTNADIETNYEQNTLTVTIHSLNTPLKNQLAQKLCDILNETETIYPKTNLKIIYKSIAN